MSFLDMKKKQTFTLLEIIIVIFLITLITGAIGYSMKGTLDKGRAFRTEQGIEQLRDLLLMSLAEGESADAIVKDPARVLKKHGLAKNPDKIIEDGWGKKYEITLDKKKTDFQISSSSLKSYKQKMGQEEAKEDSIDEG